MLYHYQVGIPALKLPTGSINLRYSTHAQSEAQSDKYGRFALPSTLDTRQAKVIEVETDNNKKVLKVVYRVALDRERDLCIVMLVDGFVKTVWVNLKTDKHKTLQTWKYNKP